MGYLHIEIEQAQNSKKQGAPCGDVVTVERTNAGTVIVLADGLGSGLKANLAAHFASSRLLELFKVGGSLRKAFLNVVQTIDKNRGTDLPWAAISVIRILPDGGATLLSYESPEMILINRRHAMLLHSRDITFGNSSYQETNCVLRSGDCLAMVSDGITQAGLGTGHSDMPEGLTSQGLVNYISQQLNAGLTLEKIPSKVHKHALALWRVAGDDCTFLLTKCREGKTINIFTGPPANKDLDSKATRSFLNSGGLHVVCGASTAGIIARETGHPLEVDLENTSPISPPKYKIEGIDLVTEGAVSLNQLNNILYEDSKRLLADNPVTELYDNIVSCDRVKFFLGMAMNPANADIVFQQQGIMPRHQVVKLIEGKLKEMGKLVEISYV